MSEGKGRNNKCGERGERREGECFLRPLSARWRLVMLLGALGIFIFGLVDLDFFRRRES